jgi:hypothetical protein
MPQPVHLGSGSGVVTFSSDLGIVQSGFSASYTTRMKTTHISHASFFWPFLADISSSFLFHS